MFLGFQVKRWFFFLYTILNFSFLQSHLLSCSFPSFFTLVISFQGTTRKATINLDEPSLGSLMKYEEGEEEDEASLEAVVEDTLAASSANTIPLAKRRKRSRHFAGTFIEMKHQF